MFAQDTVYKIVYLATLVVLLVATVALITWVVKRVWHAERRPSRPRPSANPRVQRVLGVALFVAAGLVLVATVVVAVQT
jgi:nitric oxide reductase large subunit